MKLLKISSKIRINQMNSIVLIQVCEDFNLYEAQGLINSLKKIDFFNDKYTHILILPKKWKPTIESRKLLFYFIKRSKNLIVSPSPIRRALLKTEAIYDGINPENVCCNFEEAMKKIIGEDYP